MEIELTKDDLVKLVKGFDLYSDLINKYSKLNYGSWTGGFVDKWTWDTFALEQLDEDVLYQIFLECKNLEE